MELINACHQSSKTRKRNSCRAKNKASSFTLGSYPTDFIEERSSSMATGGHSEAHTTALHAVNGYHPSNGAISHQRAPPMTQFTHDILAEFLPISSLNVSARTGGGQVGLQFLEANYPISLSNPSMSFSKGN